MNHFRGRRARVVKFLAVGGTCFVLQFTLLASMVRLGVSRPLANSASFAISAQLNFLLSSKLTWADRPAGNWRRTGARLLAYNLTALLSLGSDSAAFVLTYRVIGTTLGAGVGVLASTCLVYLVCNRLVFRPRRPAGHGSAPQPAPTQPTSPPVPARPGAARPGRRLATARLGEEVDQ